MCVCLTHLAWVPLGQLENLSLPYISPVLSRPPRACTRDYGRDAQENKLPLKSGLGDWLLYSDGQSRSYGQGQNQETHQGFLPTVGGCPAHAGKRARMRPWGHPGLDCLSILLQQSLPFFSSSYLIHVKAVAHFFKGCRTGSESPLAKARTQGKANTQLQVPSPELKCFCRVHCPLSPASPTLPQSYFHLQPAP